MANVNAYMTSVNTSRTHITEHTMHQIRPISAFTFLEGILCVVLVLVRGDKELRSLSVLIERLAAVLV